MTINFLFQISAHQKSRSTQIKRFSQFFYGHGSGRELSRGQISIYKITKSKSNLLKLQLIFHNFYFFSFSFSTKKNQNTTQTKDYKFLN